MQIVHYRFPEIREILWKLESLDNQQFEFSNTLNFIFRKNSNKKNLIKKCLDFINFNETTIYFFHEYFFF